MLSALMVVVRAITSVCLSFLPDCEMSTPFCRKSHILLEKSFVVSLSCICKTSTWFFLRGVLSEVLSWFSSCFPSFCVDFTQQLFPVSHRVTRSKLGIRELTQSCPTSGTACFSVTISLWVFGDYSLHFCGI